MKQMICGVLFVCSSLALAGTAKQDAAVAELRAEFAHGRAPADVDLKFGQVWDCTGLNAMSGAYSTWNFNPVFNRIDGILKMTIAEGAGYPSMKVYFAITKLGMIGDEDSDYAGYRDSIRVIKGQYLIDENSIDQAGAKQNSITGDPSVPFPNRIVDAYSVCKVE